MRGRREISLVLLPNYAKFLTVFSQSNINTGYGRLCALPSPGSSLPIKANVTFICVRLIMYNQISLAGGAMGAGCLHMRLDLGSILF